MRFRAIYGTNKARLLATIFLALVGFFVWYRIQHVRYESVVGQLAKNLSWIVPLASLVFTAHRFFEERQRSFQFDLTCKGYRAVLRISNYGADPIFVSKLYLRTEDVSQEFDIRRTAEKGDTEIDITDGVQKTIVSALGDDIEVSLEFQTAKKRGSTEKRGFYVFMPEGVVERISPGYDHPRDASCPKCAAKAIYNVKGLNNEDQVARRRKKVERELKRSCPGHKFQFIRAIADGADGEIRRFTEN